MERERDIEDILKQFKECIPFFSVLADEIRQNIIILLGQELEGLNVNMITERMPLSRPAISHHLKVLKQAGFVGSRKVGAENIYFLTLKEPIEKIKLLINSIEGN
ncbi:MULTISPECIES: ArsR/SmtB family transcription factor [Clostridium]|uniref:Winged helix-turn-helix transcriptional regulator n=1 Tax=Clostridium paridis TaxID=2803863 RepID=A0A937K286_9CLOT|nr:MULTISPECIES: metalloregulator ArsR/SmtB family transcription factor [Clostridium]MBL4931181.1 winged helix-turn-helix transcriptional regulator [Clostridium paridis]